MQVVRAARGDAAAGAAGYAAFKLQPEQLDVDFDSCLGGGGFASVYRGAFLRPEAAPACPPSATHTRAAL
jgi:hypothetical protein